VLLNPSFPGFASQLSDIQAAAQAVGMRVVFLRADTDSQLEAAFETGAAQPVAAIAVTASPFFDTRRERIIALAARHKMPTMYHFREYVATGGLMSYGIDAADAYRQVGIYARRVLKGEKPADLPILQASKFEFIINQKTAAALGITFSSNLISLADEVIQ
jgi:putative ABC transport system substrate-binding protein